MRPNFSKWTLSTNLPKVDKVKFRKLSKSRFSCTRIGSRLEYKIKGFPELSNLKTEQP